MKVRDIRRRQYPKRGYHTVMYRCKTDAPGCPNCDAWHTYDRLGRFPHSFDEAWETRRESA